MKRSIRRIFATLLTLTICLSLLPATVHADMESRGTLTLYNNAMEKSYTVTSGSQGKWFKLPNTQGAFLAFLIKTFLNQSYDEGFIDAWGTVKAPMADEQSGVLPGAWYPAGSKVRVEEFDGTTLYSLPASGNLSLACYYPNKGIIREGGTVVLQQVGESTVAIDGLRFIAPTGKQLAGWATTKLATEATVGIGGSVSAGEYYAVWTATPSYTQNTFTSKLRSIYSDTTVSQSNATITRGDVALALYQMVKLPDTGMATPEPNDVAWSIESETARAVHAVLNAGFMAIHSSGNFDANAEALESDVRWDAVETFKNSKYTVAFQADESSDAVAQTIEQQSGTAVDLSAYLSLFTNEGHVQTGWKMIEKDGETSTAARAASYTGVGGKTYTAIPVWASVTAGNIAVFNGNAIQHVTPSEKLPTTLDGQEILAYGTQGTFNYIRDAVMDGLWFLPDSMTAKEVSEAAGTGILYALTPPSNGDSYVIYHTDPPTGRTCAFKSSTEVMIQAAGFPTLDTEYLNGFAEEDKQLLLGWSEEQGKVMTEDAVYSRNRSSPTYPENVAGKVYQFYPVIKEDTRIKLNPPKNLQWGIEYQAVELRGKNKDGADVYKRIMQRPMPGSLVWESGNPDIPNSYYYEIYKRTGSDSEMITCGYCGSDATVYDWDGIDYFRNANEEPELNSTYYIKVRTIGEFDESKAKYKNSDFVTSPDWTFVRSEDAQPLPALTNVTWIDLRSHSYGGDDPKSRAVYEITWDLPDWMPDNEIYTYQVAHYFRNTIDAEPHYVGYSSVGGTKKNVPSYEIRAWDFAGDVNKGYHGYAIRVLTNDMTTQLSSDWSEIRYYYASGDELGMSSEYSGDNQNGMLGELLTGIDTSNGSVGKAIEQISSLDTEFVASLLQDNTNAVNQLKELEIRASGTADSTVRVDEDADDTIKAFAAGNKMTAVGTGLNSEPGKPVTFAVGDAAEESVSAFNLAVNEAFEGTGRTVPFSMKIKNAEGNEVKPESGESKLNVPVFLQLPIPESVDPGTMIILHKHSDGKIDNITPTISPDKKFASFTVSSFSDFALASAAGATVESNIVKVRPEDADADATHCAVYDENGRMLGMTDSKMNGAFSVNCDTSKASYVKLFFLTDSRPTKAAASVFIIR